MATGFPTKANWAAGDILTASAMDDLAGTVNLMSNASATTGSVLLSNAAGSSFSYSPLNAAGKNAIINGGFDIWQRGTSISNPSGSYCADRWWAAIGGAITFSQESTTVPLGSKNCMKVVSATANTFSVNQPIETLNAIQYAGKTVTVSLQTQTSIIMPLTVLLSYSTTVDNAPGGTWTSITPTSGGTFNGSVGSFTQNNTVFAVPSTAKSLMVTFSTNGASSGGFTLYVGQVQLELGSVATTFSRAGGSIGGELALCQRYFQTIGAYQTSGNLYLATACAFVTSLPVVMRTTPTPTYNATYTNAVDVTGVANRTPTAYTTYGSSASSFAFLASGFAVATIYAPATYIGGNHQLSAEL